MATTEDTHTEGIEDYPELGEDNPLGKLYRKRVAQNRDLTVLVADWNLERGSGKTTLAMRLAAACDRTDTGITQDKASLSARELTDAYTSQPKGVSLVFDEAMGDVSNRRAMSSINEALRSIIGMGRVEQKYLFLTTPGVHMVDKDIRSMCDMWILSRSLGEAQMFRVKWNPFGGHEQTHDWGTLKWPGDLPGELSSTYDYLTREKRRRLRGEGEDGKGYVEASTVQEATEEAAEDARRQKRDEMLAQLYQNSEDMTQQELADAVGLSRSRIGDILSESDG
jgi:ABC-type dipeptide/oligopeptide/nickel transport system ATPase subunit